MRGSPHETAVALAAELDERVWAMRPDALATLAQLVAREGRELAGEQIEARRATRTAGSARRPGGVAVVALSGVLMPGAGGLLGMLLGLGSGLATFRSELRTALDDPDISAVVLDIDSPGGLVDLIPETAAEVRAARGDTPIVAVANTLAASAAYWIASQADELVVTPSGEVGSVGVYATHRDVSRAQDAAGITTTLISAGMFKTEGNPYEPLGSDARGAIQASVDDYYDLFVRDVAAGRGTTATDVRDGYGQGRTLTAKRAVAAGLADRVATLEETVGRMASVAAPGV